MSRSVIVVLFSLLSTAGLCQNNGNSCWKTAKTQMEMNMCAGSDESEADTELNHVYQELLSRLRRDDIAVKKLRTAQRAWVAFRDAELEALFPAEDKQREYGTMYPMCYARLAAAMTKERTAQLRSMLDDKDPCDNAER